MMCYEQFIKWQEFPSYRHIYNPYTTNLYMFFTVGAYGYFKHMSILQLNIWFDVRYLKWQLCVFMDIMNYVNAQTS